EAPLDAVGAHGDRSQREVVLPVDLGQVAQLVIAEMVLGAEEPHVARFRRQPRETVDDEGLVLRAQEPQLRLRSVAQRDRLTVRGVEASRGCHVAWMPGACFRSVTTASCRACVA